MDSQHPPQKRARYQDPLPYSLAALCPPSFPSRPGSLIQIDCRSEDSLVAEGHARRRTGKKRQVISIDILPDDVLLAIFDFWPLENIWEEYKRGTKQGKRWQALVHVCRRWRSVVFGSPRRLNLRLVYLPGTPARDTLDVWPALPLLIEDEYFLSEGVDNIVAALECSYRVDEVWLSKGQCWWFANGKDFGSDGGPIPEPDISDALFFWRSDSPSRIPHSGYFSPEAMAACLSTLVNLLEFKLGFESPLSCPDRASRQPPPLTRTLLPELRELEFRGVSEYLEDLLVRIDAPRLSTLDTTFFNQIDFYTPQLVRFINGTSELNALEIAQLCFRNDAAEVGLSSEHQANHHPGVNVEISCQELDWQVSSLEQLCSMLFLPSTSAPEILYIYQWNFSGPYRKDTGNVENALWLALLHPFTAAKNLYLSKEITPCIVPALQELVGGRTTECLPTLKNIFLEEVEPSGPVQEAIEMFVAARQLSGHPVAVSHWEGDSLIEELHICHRRDL